MNSQKNTVLQSLCFFFPAVDSILMSCLPVEDEDEDDDEEDGESSRSTARGQLIGEDLESTDSALSSDDTGPCSSSDVTPSSETSLSDMSPAPEPTTATTTTGGGGGTTGGGSSGRRPLSKESSSASKQLTALAQLVQEHYAYTAADADGVHAESTQ